MVDITAMVEIADRQNLAQETDTVMNGSTGATESIDLIELIEPKDTIPSYHPEVVEEHLTTDWMVDKVSEILPINAAYENGKSAR